MSKRIYTAKLAFPDTFDMKEGDEVVLLKGQSAVTPLPAGAKPDGTLLTIEYVDEDGKRQLVKEWKAGTPYKSKTTPMVNFEEIEDGKNGR